MPRGFSQPIRVAATVGGAVVLVGVRTALAAVDVTQLPPPATKQVDFGTDVQPILERSCLRCHGPEKPKSRFRLDDREAALKGGSQGVDISPGHSDKSPLIHYVARLDPEMAMPPEGKGDPLSRDQVALLRAWIDQGASWGQEEDKTQVTFIVAPSVGYTIVQGNEAKFREHWWQRDGWRGGVERFEFSDRLTPDTKLTLSGHAMIDDYRAELLAEKQELGFTRLGFQQFRKYDSDVGGYVATNMPQTFSLDRDLHMDIGRAWFDVGLTLPDWPRIVLGYEYQYRTGEKATLQWGTVGTNTDLSVFPGPEARNIYPAFKAIDEHTHILKLDIDFERGGWRVEDNFRGEWTELRTRRENVSQYVIGAPDALLRDTTRDGWRSFQGANTVRVDRQYRDWLYTSAGYLYSRLTADADFSLERFGPNGALISGVFQSVEESSQQIVLERESHVANVNLLLGPWQGGVIALGVQGEWTKQDGEAVGSFTNYAPAIPILSRGAPESFLSDLDRAAINETASLRFTRLPFTTLFAEARLQQECIGHRETAVSDHSFMRDTDARSDTKDFRIGFDTSPSAWLKFGSHYRDYDKSTTYDDGFADDGTDPINGYPTFIKSRDLTTQEIESRVTLRPCRWLKTTLTHRLVATDYHTDTEPALVAVPGDASPGGRLFAGNYDAQIFSLNATLTPWRRLSLFTTVSYQDVRSVAMHDFTSTVVPYRGDIWSVLFRGQFALTKKTDLTAGYSFSAANFRHENAGDGLPVGMDYNLHGMQAGLVSRCTKTLTAKLQYGYYCYSEPSSGGANNYTAHAVFASLSWQLP